MLGIPSGNISDSSKPPYTFIFPTRPNVKRDISTTKPPCTFIIPTRGISTTNPTEKESDNLLNLGSPFDFGEGISGFHAHNEFLYISFAIIVCNLIPIALISSRKCLRKKHSNKFFLNLQISHLCIGVVNCISQVSNNVQLTFINNALLIQVFIALHLLTCDRFIAIKYPLQKMQVKARSVYLIIICAWLSSILFGIIENVIRVKQDDLAKIRVTTITVSMVTLTVFNTVVYKIAKQHVKNRNNLQNNKTLKQNALRASILCFVTVFSFVVLWLPYLIHDLLTIANLYTPNNVATVTEVTAAIALTNSITDPVLFMIFNKSVHQEMKLIVKPLKDHLHKTLDDIM